MDKGKRGGCPGPTRGEIGEIMPPKVFILTIFGFAVTFEILTSKSNQFIFVPNSNESI